MKIPAALFLILASIEFISCNNTTSASNPDPATLTTNKLKVGTWWTVNTSTLDSNSKGATLISESHTYKVTADDISIFGKDSVRIYSDTATKAPSYLAYDTDGDISKLQYNTVNGVTVPLSWFIFPIKSKGPITLVSDTVYFPDEGRGLETVVISYDGTEDVTLANHTFGCIRLKMIGSTMNLDAPFERMGGLLENLWYAPELGYLIKYTMNDTSYTPAGIISSLSNARTKLAAYSIK